MKKIGIMGGSFNPIHLGHLILAEHAYEQAELDSVLFMPLKNPPHKDSAVMVSEEHRINMIKLAIEDNSAFEYSDIEIRREGTTYTADTLSVLTSSNPDHHYYFIVGSDAFLNMQNWKTPHIIFQLSTIIVAGRDLVSRDMLEEQELYLKKHYEAKVLFLDMPFIGISSKEIRNRVNNNKSISYLVTDKVHQYIEANRLYTNL